MFREMKRKRDAGELPELAAVESAALRIRLPRDIDLSKHDPDCGRCEGGVLRYEQAGAERIPVVCRCVTRGGGVAAGPELRPGPSRN